MKLLITGGAGFIGSAFVLYQIMHHPEDSLVVLDNLTYAGTLDNLRDAQAQPNFRFVKGDIADRKMVRELFETEGFDIVVNFAAESHVDNSILHPEIFLQTNILGTQTLMDACLQYNVGRFHQISTDEVYGDLPIDRPDLLFTEESPIKPSSPYSASKAAADLLVMAYRRTYDMPVSISRCSNNYGFRHHPEKLIPLMILTALKNNPLPVYGTGKNVRDWIYTDDHCRAVDLIIRNPKAEGEIFNVGGDSERNNLEVVKEILRILGKPESLISFVTDRKGHDLRYGIDHSKLTEQLGWRPEMDFNRGLALTIDWFKSRYN